MHGENLSMCLIRVKHDLMAHKPNNKTQRQKIKHIKMHIYLGMATSFKTKIVLAVL